MTFEQLRRMHQARPFQPFDIFLADGRSLPVDHPEMLAIAPPGRMIGVGMADAAIAGEKGLFRPVVPTCFSRRVL
jgi:hypothetical protein